MQYSITWKGGAGELRVKVSLSFPCAARPRVPLDKGCCEWLQLYLLLLIRLCTNRLGLAPCEEDTRAAITARFEVSAQALELACKVSFVRKMLL